MRTRYVLACAIGLVLCSCAAGGLATSGGGTVEIALLALVGPTSWLIARCGTGFVAGLLILAAVDALPGPNLETANIANSITVQDVAVVGLGVLLLFENLNGGCAYLRRSSWGRACVMWSLAFMAWYGITVVRTWLSTPVPLEYAVTFSRDFAYLGLLLPLMFGPLCRARFRNVLLVTLGVGAVMAAVAQSVAVVSGSSLALFVHTIQTKQNAGLTRLYTSASDIPFAGLPLGLGLVLFGETQRVRRAGGVVAGASLIAVSLGLTRATYLGEIVGFTAATVVVLARFDSRAKHGRRQLAKVLGVVAVAAVAATLYAPSGAVNSAISGVDQRASSLLSDLSASSAVAVDPSLTARETETSEIEAAIGSRWLVGLGFLDPSHDYVAGTPEGDIRNPDVSLLGAVATMGAIGTVLYALPLLAVLGGLLRRAFERTSRDAYAWVSFGGLAWCVAAAIVSPTLGLFFSPAQVVASAFVLALIAVTALGDTGLAVERRHERWPAWNVDGLPPGDGGPEEQSHWGTIVRLAPREDSESSLRSTSDDAHRDP